MDIDYLLALQGLRESLPPFVTTLAEGISFIGEGPGLVAIGLLVYWVVDKRAGQLGLASFAVGTFISQLAKNIACVYRPWILDSRVVPAAGSLEGATGYSFPSGHTAGTASIIGSFAWSLRKHHKALCAVCVLFVLVMCFSRNFLGFHTPQDVLVGLLIAVVSIALAQLFFGWIERYDALTPGHGKDIVAMVVVVVVSIAAVVLVSVKPYPLDYIDGQLLVDPVDMQKGTYEGSGVFIGVAVAWVLERRLVGFSTAGIDTKTRLVRCVVGVVLVGITYVVCDLAFKAFMPYNLAKLFTMMLVIFVGTFAAPLVFDKLEKRQAR